MCQVVQRQISKKKSSQSIPAAERLAGRGPQGSNNDVRAHRLYRKGGINPTQLTNLKFRRTFQLVQEFALLAQRAQQIYFS